MGGLSNTPGADLPLPPGRFINAYLLDGSTVDMSVDGSSSNVTYKFTASGNVSIGRLILYMETATAMADDEFGDATALVNGIDVICHTTTLVNWKDNIDILSTMFDYIDAGSAFGKTGRVLTGRWTFWKADDSMRGLLLEDGQEFKAVIKDNLSTAPTTLRMRVQGIVL